MTPKTFDMQEISQITQKSNLSPNSSSSIVGTNSL